MKGTTICFLTLISYALVHGRQVPQVPHSEDNSPKSTIKHGASIYNPNLNPAPPSSSFHNGLPVSASKQPHSNLNKNTENSKTNIILEELERKGAFPKKPHTRNQATRTKRDVQSPNADLVPDKIMDSVPHHGSPLEDISESLGDHITGTIIDGIVAAQHRWKWSVELHTEEYGFICGGAIIAPKWVITAAHCVFGAPVTIHARIGSWNLSAADYVDSVPVVQIIVHPLFARKKISPYDIALLRLIREANVNATHDNMLSLPDPLFNIFELNPYCYIIGWGVVEQGSDQMSPLLREKWVNVIGNTECQSRWDPAFNSPDIQMTNICVDEDTATACHGDSGSPLQCFDTSDMRWKLAGLSSFGSMDCNYFPSVYTRAASFLNWILATMN